MNPIHTAPYTHWLEIFPILQDISNAVDDKESHIRQSLASLRRETNEDSIRTILSKNTTTDNRNLVLLLLNEVSKGDPDQALSTLDWAAFIVPFTGGSNAYLNANVSLLSGIYHLDGGADKAYDRFLNGLNHCHDFEGSGIAASFFYYHVAMIQIYFSNTDSSAAMFQKGLNLLKSPAQQAVLDWQSFFKKRQEQLQEKYELIQAVLQLPLRTERESFIAKKQAVWDEEMVNFALGTIVKKCNMKEYQAALIAAETFDFVINTNNEETSGHTFLKLLADIHFQNKNYPNAIEVYNLLLQYTPEDLEIADLITDCFLDSGQFDLARQHAGRILSKHPEHSPSLRKTGVAYFNDGKLGEASRYLQEAIRINPNDGYARHFLGELNKLRPENPVRFDPATGTMSIGMIPENLPQEDLSIMFTAAIMSSLEPTQRAASLEELHQTQGEEYTQKVLYYMGETSAPAPPKPESAVDRAEAYFMAQQFDKAREAYLEALHEDPSNEFALMGVGDCYYRSGQYYLAAAYFEESIAIKPKPMTYLFLGDAYAVTQRLDAATESYKAALSLNPQYGLAKQKLARLQQQKNQPKND